MYTKLGILYTTYVYILYTLKKYIVNKLPATLQPQH